MNFLAFIDRYEKELRQSVIPFWEKHCPDREAGGYFTFLERDGSIYDTEKFMWMQWRIAYMFATFYSELEENKKWLDIAEHGFNFLTEHGKNEEGFYYFALNRKGEPSVAAYNIFSDCFAAMGAAALYKSSGKDVYLKEAGRAMGNYIDRMANPKGKWEKSLPGRTSRQSLAHFMMLANLSRVLGKCLDSYEYRGTAEDAANRIIDKFWNKKFGVVFENINYDGTFDLISCDGRSLNPGHGLEAMWFVLEYAEEHADEKLISKASEAILGILDFGWDKKHGGIFYFMDVLGKPHIELQADMKLWWVHNEAIIAVLYAYKLTGRSVFLEWFFALDEWTWRHFPDPEFGEWFGYLNRRGEPTHTLKGGKWKTCFHLPRFLLKSVQIMKEMA